MSLMSRSGLVRSLPVLVTMLGLATVACIPTAAIGADAAKARTVDPLDWPSWRGPEQNGVSRETGLIDNLDLDGPDVLWKNPEAGGISTPIVLGGKIYTIVRSEPDTINDAEKLICLDAATGKKLWENRWNVFLSDVPAERIGWSCAVGDPTTGRIYVQGVCGYFTCIDGDSGKTVWSRSMSEDFGLLTTYGGRTNVPIVFEDLVIISGVVTGWDEMARPAHRVLAFDKSNGEVIWFNGTRPLPEDTTYSTPVTAVLGGQAALVFGSGDGGLYAFQPRTGKQIWKYQLSRRGINTTPVVNGDTVYIGHSEENLDDTSMGALVALDGALEGDITKNGAKWRDKQLMVGRAAPLSIDNRVYAVDDSAAVLVVDATTGELVGRKQKVGTVQFGSPIYADGKIYIFTKFDRWAVLRPTEKGYEKVNQGRTAETVEVQGSPIVSHGRIYVPTTTGLYCLGKADAKPQATPRPELPKETPVESDKNPALVQVLPVEALLKPGEKLQYRVRLFNARGQLLGESPAQFSAKGPGEIDSATGLYTAASSPEHSATFVEAKVGNLVGKARIRVVPPLPWKFDFANNAVPITWVGANYRHVPRTVDGNPMIVKVTTIPKGTRSQAWMGPTDLHDYTIQSDVRAVPKSGQLPDVGLIAQRYTLDMMGVHQQLQIRTWTATLRMAQTVPFEWKANVWYTMKFRASVEDGQAVLRGKVWERDKPEPAEWLIEAKDPSPNVTGSPGLFGNSTNGEIFYDNLSVTSN
jgi:outer membrane protein assembly factor BamB